MTCLKFQVKLFLDDDASVDHEALIRTFHGWIRDKVIDDELAIDVADYGHVPDGPGIVLIGHHSDYYVDEAAPKGGLIFSRKRGGPEGTEASIADAFTRALKAAKTLEADDTLKLGFGAATVQVKAMDRLNAPNDDAGWAAIEPALANAAKAVFGDGATVARDSVADREPLTATVTTGRSERALRFICSARRRVRDGRASGTGAGLRPPNCDTARKLSLRAGSTSRKESAPRRAYALRSANLSQPRTPGRLPPPRPPRQRRT